MRILQPFPALILFIMFAACSEQPMVIEYFPETVQENDDSKINIEDIVWPGLPDVPRYRYAGQLRGEDNFSPDIQNRMNTGEKFIRWLIGLGQTKNRPRQLVRPQSGMVGQDGRIFVTDVGYQAVFVFDTAGGKLSIWDSADKNTYFDSPIGIATSNNNEILVADSKLARIVRLNQNGDPLGSFGEDILQRPTGIATDPDTGNIYVSDTITHDIKYFDQTGNLLGTIGRRGTEAGEFNGPTFLCIANNNLYVSDTLNARVQILTLEGEPVSIIGKRGLYVGNLTHPKGVTVDSEGNIYIIESYYDHLLVFNTDGEFLIPIGGLGSEIGNFFLPSGIWSDAQNRIFTADMFNSRIIIMQYLGE